MCHVNEDKGFKPFDSHQRHTCKHLHANRFPPFSEFVAQFFSSVLILLSLTPTKPSTVLAPSATKISPPLPLTPRRLDTGSSFSPLLLNSAFIPK